MPPAAQFQRARAPEQVEQRRKALLAATAELLHEGGLPAVTLSEIARRAGLAKSNVYRYFESREDMLLQLTVEEETAWVGELERALAAWARSDDVGGVAAAIARTFTDHPTLCELVTAVATVIEHNVSTERVIRFKTEVAALSLRIGNAVQTALPGLPHEATPGLIRYVQALVAGLYPMAHPSGSACEALDRPEFAAMRSDFLTDLRDALTAMLRGLMLA